MEIYEALAIFFVLVVFNVFIVSFIDWVDDV